MERRLNSEGKGGLDTSLLLFGLDCSSDSGDYSGHVRSADRSQPMKGGIFDIGLPSFQSGSSRNSGRMGRTQSLVSELDTSLKLLEVVCMCDCLDTGTEHY
jgi:hypothetical protein